MARIKIGNVKPKKGVDYFTPADIQEMGKEFAPKEELNTLSESLTNTLNESLTNITTEVSALKTSMTETNTEIESMPTKYAPAYTYGTEELIVGESQLETGKLHFVYE